VTNSLPLPPRKKERGLAGLVTSELQVVGKAASIAIQTWVRNNDKTKAREERENIGWIGRPRPRFASPWRWGRLRRFLFRARRLAFSLLFSLRGGSSGFALLRLLGASGSGGWCCSCHYFTVSWGRRARWPSSALPHVTHGEKSTHHGCERPHYPRPHSARKQLSFIIMTAHN